MRSQALIRADLQHAIADGDTAKVQKLANELAGAPLVERAQQVQDLRRVLAELAGQRSELQAHVTALRMRALAAQDAIREAEKTARLAARDVGAAANRFSQHNARMRELQAELDALLAASDYEALTLQAPVVHALNVGRPRP